MNIQNLTFEIVIQVGGGGGQDKPPWTNCPHPCSQVCESSEQRKQLNLTWIMFIIYTDLHSDSLK